MAFLLDSAFKNRSRLSLVLHSSFSSSAVTSPSKIPRMSFHSKAPLSQAEERRGQQGSEGPRSLATKIGPTELEPVVGGVSFVKLLVPDTTPSMLHTSRYLILTSAL